MLVAILKQVLGGVLIFVAVVNASGPLRPLVRAGRSGIRFRAISGWAWGSLRAGLVWAVAGVSVILDTEPSWLGWFFLPVAIAGLASVVSPGIVSRRRAGVSWWRFWERVIPPPPAEPTGPGADAYRSLGGADALYPGPPIVLDAKTSGLIQRIENAKFRTTRLSSGYDEEEVDILLDRLVAILAETGQPDQEELHNVHFTRTRLRPGYVMQDVDGLLREIAQATRV